MTQSTTIYSPGDIVLAKYPFTDAKGTKLRPCLVLSQLFEAAIGTYHLCVPITSNLGANNTRIGIVITGTDAIAAGLIKDSLINPSMIYALGPRYFERHIGALQADQFERVLGAACEFLGCRHVG